MRRRASNDDDLRISLFPFLAVLLCTMGALVVLLVVIARRAQASAQQEVAAQETSIAADQEETRERLIRLEEQIDTARQALERTKTQRSQWRRELSHLENHLQRLVEQFRELRRQAEELAGAEGGNTNQLDELKKHLAGLQQEIADAELRLAEAAASNRAKKVAFAVVPYDGRNPTTRRPMYIECLSDKVILQPEGIELTETDFEDAEGPANPLATTLRAEADYLSRLRSATGVAGGEPYPYVLVRPNGIRAFYAVKAALSEWNSEIGYELIGADWELAYPPADPQMGAEMYAALEVARRQLAVVGRQGRGRGPFTSPQGRASQSENPLRGGSELNGGGTRASNNFGGGSEGSRTVGEGENGSALGNPAPTPNSQAKVGGSPAMSEAQNGQPFNSSPGQLSAGEPGGPTAGGGSLRCLSGVRGSNWALPKSSQDAVPIDKPVVVECAADRLVILPRSSNVQPQVVWMHEGTQAGVDEFVSALWEHMKSWGIAGRGLYWRPVIALRVVPGGERRAADLATLLEGSGLELNGER